MDKGDYNELGKQVPIYSSGPHNLLRVLDPYTAKETKAEIGLVSCLMPYSHK